MNRKHLSLGLLLLVVLALVMSACAPATPAAPELGTAENPIIFSFVPSSDAAEVLASATAITDRLSELTGLTIQAEVPTSYVASVEALCAGEAHVGALATFAYVLASNRGCAEIAFISVRSGSSTYKGMVIAGVDSGIATLEDLRGKTFCRQSATSTSGWIMPSLLIKAAGVDPDTDLGEIKDTGGHDLTAIAVYDGDCDAGAAFDAVLDQVAGDYPDVKDKVIIIATTDPIPNDGVAFATDVPEEIRAQIVQAFHDMVANEADLAMLGDLYRWTGIEEQDDSFYDPFRQFLDAAGVEVEDYVGG